MANVRILTARPHRLFAPVAREIGEKLRHGQESILLVPEQLTLQAERDLMDLLKLDGLFLIDVLSPSRLYERILESGGRDQREPLSSSGRRMAVSLALERLEEKLEYYGALSSRKGFVEKTAALITDLKRGGLSPEVLGEYARRLPEGITREKLLDLSMIYAQYEAVLGQRFSDSEDQLAYVAQRLGQSGYLQGKHLYVYGFDTLPDQLMRLLCAAASICDSLTVALLCDGVSAADGELFLPVRQGIGRFTEMLEEKGLEVKQVAAPSEPLKTAPVFAHLDKYLFTLSPKRYEEPQQQVFRFDALSPHEEATLMTRQVLRLLAEGMDVERIAVLYPDSNGYAFAVSAALRDSGIPFYADQKLPALSHGLVRYLLCAIRAISDGYRNRDVLGLMKSGYAPLTYEECCDLENYAYTYGIDRARWLKPFTRGGQEECARCEALRQRLIDPLVRARAALVAARNASQSIEAVFSLLEDVGAYQTLQQEEGLLLEAGLVVRQNQNSQVWQAVLTLLDQMVRLSDTARIPLKHIATRMECGFSALSLAALPPAGQMLHVGTLGHSLAENVDALFLMGLNDGVLDKDTQSLLTPEERQQAQEETGCFLGLTDDNRIRFAKLDLKRAMTLPEGYLFLSCAKTAPDGTALRPLAMVHNLQEQLIAYVSASPVDEDKLPLSATQALAELSLALRAHRDGMGVTSLLPQHQEWMRKLLENKHTAPAAMRLLRAVRYDGNAQPITPEQARSLFGEETLSISRLEEFGRCPFKHYLHYGLRPHVLREWRIDPIETGNFYHDALHRFSQLARRESAYPEVSAQRVRQLADEAMEPVIEEAMSGPLGDGERNQWRFQLAQDAVHRAAQVITDQLAAGSFQLYRTEASFGYENGLPPIVLSLQDGRQVTLRGRIDRIDRYDSPESVYLRVIDYKSSKQSLEAAQTWWGLQLQLLLYLDVCTAHISGSKPAGAFYFYVDDPLMESSSDMTEAVEELLRDTFRLKGITLYDVEVLEAMDGGETACVIPPVVQKGGELRKNAKALSMQQMTALIQHARQEATRLAGELFSGVTEILPLHDGMPACAMCDYRAVCHFDPDRVDASMREVPKMDMDQLRAALDDSLSQ
ncbi:MAG: hypothetical protein E7319_04455 [Clostridiales bacterium]|nr:hypothetical protein [Clostridiales bacterium]